MCIILVQKVNDRDYRVWSNFDPYTVHYNLNNQTTHLLRDTSLIIIKCQAIHSFDYLLVFDPDI